MSYFNAAFFVLMKFEMISLKGINLLTCLESCVKLNCI